MFRRSILALTLRGFGLFSLIGLAACSSTRVQPTEILQPSASYEEPGPVRVRLSPVAMESLPGWRSDSLLEVLPALKQSCVKFLYWDGKRPVGKTALGGRAEDWKPACEALKSGAITSEAQARAFFTQHFHAFNVASSQDGPNGTFTGYYVAHVFADTKPSARYPYPLYAPPKDVKDRSGAPDLSRKAIEQGSLKAQGLEVLWVSDPVDAFLLHVQGSGIASLPSGHQLHVSYAGNNGHKFKGLHEAMKAHGFDGKKEGMTMTAFARWLKAHPKKAQTIMWSNPRYIFFAVKDEPGAVGAMGLPLTATRSMAVDPTYIPLGVPLWLSTKFSGEDGAYKPIQRMMVAQDTGSAIKGAVRGDFFWGAGAEASWAASRMKSSGSYAIILPKAVSLARLRSSSDAITAMR